jgi:cell division protein FtsB
MDKLKAFFRVVKPVVNKYTIALGLFALIMSFGEYSWFQRVKLTNSVERLEKEKKQYEDDLQKAKSELNSLNKNTENLERMAREKYLMHKPNEDVFIVKEK